MKLPTTMRAVVWDGTLRVADAVPVPDLQPGWALIRVDAVGICGTDRALIAGYKGFSGIPGHEMVGTVVACSQRKWMGRVVAADINVGCGHCNRCRVDGSRHCPDRRVLGMIDLDGAMAEYCTLPTGNLVDVSALPRETAVLAEPLAAACRILDVIPVDRVTRVVVLGDGPLGILCAWVLRARTANVTLAGHHPSKLTAASWRDLKTANVSQSPLAKTSLVGADLVVDATGSATGVTAALALCGAGGTVVVKSTSPGETPIPMADLVVNEIHMVGSRCGRVDDAVQWMRAYPDAPLGRLITGAYPMDDVSDAFADASGAASIKVIIRP